MLGLLFVLILNLTSTNRVVSGFSPRSSFPSATLSSVTTSSKRLFTTVGLNLRAGSDIMVDTESNNIKKPILVVGATGKVGRLVVNQLLEQNIPTRAFVRNSTKANELFSSKNVEIVVGDISDMKKMEEAVAGCQAVISVSGTMRFSKMSDFLPWRLFQFDASKWCSDKSHPYFTNYLAQVNLAILASKHGLTNGVVRLTGLSTGMSPFSLVSILFSSVLSMTSRYHYAAERDMYRECQAGNIPFIVLRPGGLSDEPRNRETTSLQAEPSGLLPPPARIGRADVAALAISCVLTKSSTSRVLAIRWCGENINPKAQGSKEDGCQDASKCLERIENEGGAEKAFNFEYPKKSYALAVSCLIYPLWALSLKLIFGVLKLMQSKI